MEVIQDKYYEFQEFYNWALSVSDKRVENWFLMGGYTQTLVITAIYVLLVTVIIPKFMENRAPMTLKWPIVIYNVICIAINFHITSQLFYNTTKVGYSYSCQTVDYSDNPYEVNIAKALWWFYFSKCVEMMDTVFFALRKKNNQISFLHVYHHATMFPIWWMGVKWVAGGQSFFGAMVNSFIHVIMYTYYAIAALGPQYQKYLWWKRYLTIIQLTQFFAGMVYGVQALIIDCDYPKWMLWTSLVYGVSIIALFMNYYIQEYIKRTNAKRREKIQFNIGIIHAGQSLIFRCAFPLWMQWALIVYGLSILSLFLNFYFQAYIKSQRTRKTKPETQVTGDKKKSENGAVTNGVANGHVETKKDK